MTDPVPLKAVKDALANPVAPPADDAPEGARRHDGGEEGGSPPRFLPDDCPVQAVGTEDGVFWFLTSLGELRGLKARECGNKDIVGLFAPDSAYLEKTWPQGTMVVRKDPAGKPLLDEDGFELKVFKPKGGGAWKTDFVAMLLMDAAATKGVWNAREKVRGRGAWRAGDGSLIVHFGDHVLMGGVWKEPGMYDGMVYPRSPAMARPCPAEWANASGERIAPDLTGQLRARAESSGYGGAIASDISPGHLIIETFRTWGWERPDVDPWLLLGWIGAGMLGGALDYRPLAWITGGARAGKSTLQGFVGQLNAVPEGMLQSSEASEAGVRQVLGQQSLPVSLDEAEGGGEGSAKVHALVKLARLAATSQGNIYRGGQDHKGHEFRATTCFLFSSILVPAMPPQDLTRIAMLRLGPLPSGQRFRRFDDREIRRLGQWMRRRMIDSWGRWPAVLDAFRDMLIDEAGQDNRGADQFGTLLAAAYVLLADGVPDAATLSYWAPHFRREALAETSDQEGEGERCVRHLRTSIVNLPGHGMAKLVEEWVAQAQLPPSDYEAEEVERRLQRKAAKAMLARVGLAIVTARSPDPALPPDKRPVAGMPYLAVCNSHEGLSKLFNGTDWAKGVWGQALGYLPGAIRNRPAKVGGSTVKTVWVPMAAVIEPEGAEDEDAEHPAAAGDDDEVWKY